MIYSRVFWFLMVEMFSLLLLFVMFWRFLLEKGHTWQKILLVGYALYSGAVIVLLLFPTDFSRPFHFTTEHLNLIPFRSLSYFRANPVNTLGGILLFVPLGFFSVLTDKVKAGGRLLHAGLRAALTSFLFEFFQLFISRVSDIDDIILNTIGGLLGGLLCVIWHKTRLDHTGIGQKIMPELPKKWRGKLALPLFTIILFVCYTVAGFTTNAMVAKADIHQCTAEINGKQVTFRIDAENAMLYDLTDEKNLFSLASEDPIYPASTVKLLAALTALDISAPEEEVTVGTEIYLPPSDCSKAGLEPDMTLTVEELLSGVLIPSGADATYTLAAYCGRKLMDDKNAPAEDAIAAFVEAENEYANEIGATDTVVKSVEGYDEDGQHTTVQDLLIIAKAAMADPTINAICGTAHCRIGSGSKSVDLSTTNSLIDPDNALYNKAFHGIKTGTTSLAGNCLISTFYDKGKEYLCIIMNSSYAGRYEDTLTLYRLIAN